MLASKLNAQINTMVSSMDVFSLERALQKIVTSLRNNMAEARLDVRDFELSETRDEQLAHARQAKKRLNHVRKDILAASEYNIFSSVDVAQFTGEIDHINERLE